jgi:hypothetical protein
MHSRRIPSGVWLCLALVVFGGGMVLAFFWAARKATHPDVSSVSFGVPSMPLRLVSWNVKREAQLADAVAEQIRRFDPDFLFLQETHGKALPDLQRQLGGKLVSITYYPLQNVPLADNDIGNAILSKYPLEEGRPIPNHMNGACGVWASTIVEKRRFYVACLRLSEKRQEELANFAKAWESLGKPPMVAAVERDADSLEVTGLTWHAEDRIWLFSGDWIGSGATTSANAHRIEVRGKALSGSAQGTRSTK